jgi:lauroyl/myristoyl acyltransferase
MNAGDIARNPLGGALIRYTPHFAAYAARLLADRLFPAGAPATKRVEENFASVFPERTPAQIRTLARKYRRSMFEYALEQMHLDLLPQKELVRYCTEQVELVGGDHFQAALERPEPIVVFAPHYGNFAVVSLRIAIEARGKKNVHFFFNPPEKNAYSPRIQRLFQVLDHGVEAIMNDRAGVVKASRALDRGELVGIMPDVAEFDPRALFVPFFRRLAVAMGGTAHLALRSNATVLPMYAWRVAAGRFVMEVCPPLPLVRHESMEESVYATTAAIFRNMEEMITARPEHWMYWDTFATRVFNGVTLPTSAAGWREQLTALQKIFAAGDSELGTFLQQLAIRMEGQQT